MASVCVIGWKWPELQQVRWHPLRKKRAISIWASARYKKSRPSFSKFFFHRISLTRWKFVQVCFFLLLIFVINSHSLVLLVLWGLLLCLLWEFLSKLEFLLPSTENPLVCGGPSPCHSGQCEYNRTINRHICRCPAGILGDQCQIGEPCNSLRNMKNF